MHLSLMPITLAGASAAETVAAAARAGYDSVGVTLWQPGAPDPGAALGSVREIKEELRSSGIALLAVEALCLDRGAIGGRAGAACDQEYEGVSGAVGGESGRMTRLSGTAGAWFLDR